ncbi:MAG: hypothetical protein H0U67_10030 [Gemmatimonadetes bacterium]|nr:hypothetical protein [Gemmatimonadota bacterium]
MSAWLKCYEELEWNEAEALMPARALTPLAEARTPLPMLGEGLILILPLYYSPSPLVGERGRG